ncbi:hypothetical protein EVAR_75249_1 [Eumeta japonica]|uniref:Uncharacterized protein n=1 Tax=Eumeta variegata TaxID=151549 RepID=A0A4C1V8Z3_EUMVA|nr:hypothetical protein EVAR_75249_1 [Eumeta japonica]
MTSECAILRCGPAAGSDHKAKRFTEFKACDAARGGAGGRGRGRRRRPVCRSCPPYYGYGLINRWMPPPGAGARAATRAGYISAVPPVVTGEIAPDAAQIWVRRFFVWRERRGRRRARSMRRDSALPPRARARPRPSRLASRTRSADELLPHLPPPAPIRSLCRGLFSTQIDANA